MAIVLRERPIMSALRCLPSLATLILWVNKPPLSLLVELQTEVDEQAVNSARTKAVRAKYCFIIATPLLDLLTWRVNYEKVDSLKSNPWCKCRANLPRRHWTFGAQFHACHYQDVRVSRPRAKRPLTLLLQMSLWEIWQGLLNMQNWSFRANIGQMIRVF